MEGRYRNFPVQLIIAVNLIIVAYMLYSITAAVYRDYKNELHLLQLRKENEMLRDDRIKKEMDVYYFSSPNYRDKFAKQQQGKINPGEKVIAFAEVEENVYTESDEDDGFKKGLLMLPNPEQWYEYYFGGKF